MLHYFRGSSVAAFAKGFEMETVKGTIEVHRIACLYCGDEHLMFAHNKHSSWRCAGCNRRMSYSDTPYDEELVIRITISVGDQLIVEELDEDYE